VPQVYALNIFTTTESIFTTAIFTADFVNTGGEIFSPAVPNESDGENDNHRLPVARTGSEMERIITAGPNHEPVVIIHFHCRLQPWAGGENAASIRLI
jgi:hypothetical protein